jgi:Cohesin domain
MKQLLPLAALAAGLCLRPAMVAAAPTLSVGTVTAKAGTTAAVPIALSSDAKNVSGLSITLTTPTATGADSLLGAAVDAQSAFTQLENALFDWSNKDGVFRAAAVKAEPLDGPLPVVVVQIPIPAGAAAGTTYPLTLTAKLNDPDGVPITVTVVDGSIKVE